MHSKLFMHTGENLQTGANRVHVNGAFIMQCSVPFILLENIVIFPYSVMDHLCTKCAKELKKIKVRSDKHEKRHELTGKYKCTTCSLPTFSKFNHDRHDCEHKKNVISNALRARKSSSQKEKQKDTTGENKMNLNLSVISARELLRKRTNFETIQVFILAKNSIIVTCVIKN